MRRQFGDEVDVIIEGFPTGGSAPSEIKSLSSGVILRSKA
jgi:tRNA A37 threonylcarbamoyladenosine synthetase subunit TsaC/SUA5/YrdC